MLRYPNNAHLKDVRLRLCTLNVHRLCNATGINNFIIDYNIDICGMQEVGGLLSLKKLSLNNEYEALFDESYKTYGNGLIYNKNKLTFVSKRTTIISNNYGKKSLFEVVLKYNHELITIYVTHLNHISEPKRLYEWYNIQNLMVINRYFILGDFNALTKSDYSEKEWHDIKNVREKDNWELPVEDLTLEIKKQYHDCLAEKGTIKNTSRFDTRIDYIYTKSIDMIINTEVIDIDISDHKPVICDIVI